ncbi:isocitrate lyase/PEP mutase family protein [Pseudomonas akapageensis]|uniref:isocitrate lyase/PEP mutase family protein n=1 Tax=Pseudomonas akapageensis TaxID=2609961 RepID=UPI001409B717|nr:isocitrate lyase/phosphoenolpyruvate mutase family protein [Pseudomonas akapageensis]
MDVQTLRAQAFKALHERDGAFVIPNPWDAGSAKLLASLGFEALATTSAGLAFSLGRPDGEGAISREETLINARSIVDATALPVAADLENGFADDPEGCAETIRQAAAAGLVGGSIEDATGLAEAPIYPFAHAVARVEAAVAAARSLPFPFMLTARAENFLNGRMDLDDTIARLQAFAEAGADVLYAPGLRTREEIAAVVQALAPKPVNVLMGLSGVRLTVDELSDLGVKRISVGSSLARAAYGAFFRAAEDIAGHGRFDFAEQAMPFAQLNQLFKR